MVLVELLLPTQLLLLLLPQPLPLLLLLLLLLLSQALPCEVVLELQAMELPADHFCLLLTPQPIKAVSTRCSCRQVRRRGLSESTQVI
jgi:hypothetical protein